MPKDKRKSEKIIPLFKSDDDEKQTELKDGQQGHGLLVRKYINDLRMDFYVGRSSEKGKEAMPISIRLPEDVAKDISIMVASQKTRFRDRSEFIRTMMYIGLNYYAPIVEGKLKEQVTLRDLEDLADWQSREEARIKNIIEKFRDQLPNVIEDGHISTRKYITEMVSLINQEDRKYIKSKLVKGFSEAMRKNHIEPEDYFEVEK